MTSFVYKVCIWRHQSVCINDSIGSESLNFKFWFQNTSEKIALICSSFMWIVCAIMTKNEMFSVLQMYPTEHL